MALCTQTMVTKVTSRVQTCVGRRGRALPRWRAARCAQRSTPTPAAGAAGAMPRPHACIAVRGPGEPQPAPRPCPPCARPPGSPPRPSRRRRVGLPGALCTPPSPSPASRQIVVQNSFAALCDGGTAVSPNADCWRGTLSLDRDPRRERSVPDRAAACGEEAHAGSWKLMRGCSWRQDKRAGGGLAESELPGARPRCRCSRGALPGARSPSEAHNTCQRCDLLES